MPYFAAQHVTDMPTIVFQHNDVKEDPQGYFKKLQRYDRAGCMMMCASNQGTNDQQTDGIILGHAYTIISVHEIQAHGSQ